MRNLLPACLILPLLMIYTGCRSGPERTAAIGEAYAGPAALKLRKDIPLQSPVVATVKHGERLEIIQRRRRFLKVRTAKGAEGWTDEPLLLNSEEMANLQNHFKANKSLPSQGVATTFDMLNVHTEPSRQSPSFLQVKAGEKVDVLAYRVAPRTAPPRKPLVPPTPKRPAAMRKKKESRYPLPLLPPPPPPPANWLELSKTPAALTSVAAEEAKQTAPVPMDDWTLIRTARGESGWVLTRRLWMAIPDEVAQYAEGRRITSYFPLGEVHDGDTVKHNWLWTTINGGLQPYDFDSFRVFIWNLRRHRYETAYIERNLKGYFPVRLHPVEFLTAARGRGAPVATTNPGFSVCVEKSDGRRYRRSYAFLVNIVRSAGERPCETSAGESPAQPSSGPVASAQSPHLQPEDRSLYQRFKKRLAGLRGKWLGR